MVSSPPPSPLREMGGGEIFFRKQNFVGGNFSPTIWGGQAYMGGQPLIMGSRGARFE